MSFKSLFIKSIYSAALLFVIASCGVGNKGKESINKENSKENNFGFSFPEVPEIYSSEEKLRYLISHFWDKFDFTNPEYYTTPEVTEQIFADYIAVMSYSNEESVRFKSIDGMLNRAFDNDTASFAFFTDLYDKYLYDPNSPSRNEEIYIDVLQSIVKNGRVGDVHKIRYASRLKRANNNRPGTKALDFSYTLKSGKKGNLHSLTGKNTLIFFNNPDCEECYAIKTILGENEIFANNPKLRIMSIYPDKDISLWKETEYPSSWINGYSDEVDNKYDLRAIPSLYLLDENGKVIIKDAQIDVVYETLAGMLGYL